MKKLTIFLAYLILLLTIGFNLWLNFPETKIIADPNDNIFQYSLVARTNWVWKNYGCPLSLSCLPNLLDHNVTAWAEGYPLPFYYSHIPQIIIVSSYHLLIQPITSIFHLQFSIYNYYNLTKYLLLCFFPLPVFFALQIAGFSPILSALGGFFAAHFSTDGLYGIDPPSFLWRGYGLTSQLYAMFFLPLGLAFTYKALAEKPKIPIKIKNNLDTPILSTSNTKWAAVFLTLTTAGHLGMGIIGLLSTLPFLFLDLKLKNIFKRAQKAFIIYIFLFISLSYWIIPILINNNYHIISFWDPIWKFNSYGWYEVIRQFFQGEIFDWGRAPIITALCLIGFFVLALKKYLFSFAVLFAFWVLAYFGRTTWGGLIDLIPGMKDFHQHRFIIGVQISSLFLIPAGLDYCFSLLKKIIKKISLMANLLLNDLLTTSNFEGQISKSLSTIKIYTTIIFYVLSTTFISVIVYFTAKQTINYAQLNNHWIKQANEAYLQDKKNFEDLTSYLKDLPYARIYAGRPGNWGKEFRLGSSQIYMLLGAHGFDISQFLPETWSMLSENEQNFDERIAEDYNLLNIRYIVADRNHDFTKKAQMVKKFGPFQVYQVPTTGWFEIVKSPMFVKTDKTNFINIVHYWHRSYPRRYKMHPLISVERKPEIPSGMQKIIEMKDEVTYNEITNGSISKGRNIFSDFPFVFPEATASGKIIEEKIKKQTYSAMVDVPNNCQENCYLMFKMSYHPNWQLKIDSQPAKKYAVFPFYLATKISPGIHTVKFTYKPNKLKIVLLSIEPFILLGIISIMKRKFSNKN